MCQAIERKNMKIEILDADTNEMKAFKNAILEESSQDEFYKTAIDKCPDKFEDLFNYIKDAVQKALREKDPRIMSISGGACVGADFMLPVTKEFFVDYEARQEARKKEIEEANAKRKAIEENALVNKIKKYISEMSGVIQKGKQIDDLTYLKIVDWQDKLDIEKAKAIQKTVESYYAKYNELYVNIKKEPKNEEKPKNDKLIVEKPKAENKANKEANKGYEQINMFDLFGEE